MPAGFAKLVFIIRVLFFKSDFVCVQPIILIHEISYRYVQIFILNVILDLTKLKNNIIISEAKGQVQVME